MEHLWWTRVKLGVADVMYGKNGTYVVLRKIGTFEALPLVFGVEAFLH